ncbi:ATP-binding cassette domain-containing protein [Pyruvatibacter mobilis]|uniref:ATP-binding cassette domain-containing protein n=1 Tax=Pyruvatibacter mobilis TaxID=1712261 RepID=A0A845Q8L7_9HYPH|nr:ABC transporter ATP-binding protein [Pyruvatibacter mobilis]NBG94401.1 ATP-binding cassette domain-containing protein [Pyruvatibacter mobilis]QJD73928.1 ABC transporter ATP-binding protein [Pyruvatibacter mobilis]
MSKVYNLYDSQGEQLLHQSGVSKFMFWRSPPNFREFRALNNVSIRIPAGDRLGIVGRNGAGKTTLLKLITRNFAPTTGNVQVNGSVQALMQLGIGFHPEFTGYDNIRAALAYNGLDPKALTEAMEDIIDFVELGDFLHQPMKTYSLGMNARLQFATATAIRPDILIIDEIMGAGDSYFAAKSAHRMERLTKSGCTLLLVSHSSAQVLQFCEDALWLDGGSVRMEGKALEVVKAYEEYVQELSFQQQRQAKLALAAPDNVEKASSEEQRDYDTPDWQKDQLMKLVTNADSTTDTVSRWPGEHGMKISRVEVRDQKGLVNGMIDSGQPMTIEVDVSAEHDGHFFFKLSILVMSLEGVGLSRHLSPEFERNMKEGENTTVKLVYPETMLAKGEFVFSVGLFKEFDPDDTNNVVRYDLLSRSFKIKVHPKTNSEPALFHHPAHWETEPE